MSSSDDFEDIPPSLVVCRYPEQEGGASMKEHAPEFPQYDDDDDDNDGDKDREDEDVNCFSGLPFFGGNNDEEGKNKKKRSSSEVLSPNSVVVVEEKNSHHFSMSESTPLLHQINGGGAGPNHHHHSRSPNSFTTSSSSALPQPQPRRNSSIRHQIDEEQQQLQLLQRNGHHHPPASSSQQLQLHRPPDMSPEAFGILEFLSRTCQFAEPDADYWEEQTFDSSELETAAAAVALHIPEKEPTAPTEEKQPPMEEKPAVEHPPSEKQPAEKPMTTPSTAASSPPSAAAVADPPPPAHSRRQRPRRFNEERRPLLENNGDAAVEAAAGRAAVSDYQATAPTETVTTTGGMWARRISNGGGGLWPAPRRASNDKSTDGGGGGMWNRRRPSNDGSVDTGIWGRRRRGSNDSAASSSDGGFGGWARRRFSRDGGIHAAITTGPRRRKRRDTQFTLSSLWSGRDSSDERMNEFLTTTEADEENNNFYHNRKQQPKHKRTYNIELVPVAPHETERVDCAKWFMKAMVVLATFVAGGALLYYNYCLQQQRLHAQFSAYSQQLFATATNRFDDVSSSLKSFSRSITLSSQNDNDSSWPFVTIPHFNERALAIDYYSSSSVKKDSHNETIDDLIFFAPVVPVDQEDKWNEYANKHYSKWLRESIMDNGGSDASGTIPTTMASRIFDWEEIDPAAKNNQTEVIAAGDLRQLQDNALKLNRAVRLPIWQVSPVSQDLFKHLNDILNLDLFSILGSSNSDRILAEIAKSAVAFEDQSAIVLPMSQNLSKVFWGRRSALNSKKGHDNGSDNVDGQDSCCDDHGFLILQPVWTTVITGLSSSIPSDKMEIAGFLVAVQRWTTYLDNTILPEDENGLMIFVRSTQFGDKGLLHPGAADSQDGFTFFVDSQHADHVGFGDLHDPKHSKWNETFDWGCPANRKTKDRIGADIHGNYTSKSATNETVISSRMNKVSHCAYTLTVYSSASLFYSNARYLLSAAAALLPLYFVGAVLLAFTISVTSFIYHDRLVQTEANRGLSLAEKTMSIVAHLYPTSIQERIMKEAVETNEKIGSKKENYSSFAKHKMVEFLDVPEQKRSKESKVLLPTSKPIADYFPETTMMFADIVGFTAWSSVREPVEVFKLLETLFNAFDDLARSRGIFKVETVGDCYVAVCGIPQYNPDHAVNMCRFAHECMQFMHKSTIDIEVTFGPDTYLGMRFGLHSGPVTAGVLRSERSRFQLFGESVNVAHIMECKGQRNKIHISRETADLLKEAGKGHWVKPRADKVKSQETGTIQTYWLEIKAAPQSNTNGGMVSGVNLVAEQEINAELKQTGASPDKERQERIVDWVSDVMISLLKEVVAKRPRRVTKMSEERKLRECEEMKLRQGSNILSEVTDVVDIVKPSKRVSSQHQALDYQYEETVSDAVLDQLREYIQAIAVLYNDGNPFHNFEHASHVTMSAVKFLFRLKQPETGADGEVVDNSLGITSDPMTKFAILFSALIHDVDHPGVGNSVLVKEGTRMAKVYKMKSVAEQNSFDISWDLLMDPRYIDLRRTIYSTPEEFLRFRQIVVNAVMATDVWDKNHNKMREVRWNAAFGSSSQTAEGSFKQRRFNWSIAFGQSRNNVFDDDGGTEQDEIVSKNRKATVAVEYLMQASDFSHTMQHWHVYHRWNTRWFEENYKAYLIGRLEKDPSENWCETELDFFDSIVIPLAHKLIDSEIFGAQCGNEHLANAIRNKEEWLRRGNAIVDEMVGKVKASMKSRPCV